MGFTVREFIEELEDFAKQYGDNTELTIIRENDEEDTPIISGGPDKFGVSRCTISSIHCGRGWPQVSSSR